MSKRNAAKLETEDQAPAAGGQIGNAVLPSFSGIAISVVCAEHSGHTNMRILRLHIKDGKVESVDQSDPFLAFDLNPRVEIMAMDATNRLSRQWGEGKTWDKFEHENMRWTPWEPRKVEA